METLINMGFTDREFTGPLTKEQLEQQQMVRSGSHLIRFLIFCFQISSNNNNSSVSCDDLSMNNPNSFTKDAFLDLETKVNGDKWSIPYKRSLDKNIGCELNLIFI